MTPFDLFRDYVTIIDYQKLARAFKGKKIIISKSRYTKANKIFLNAGKFYQAIIRLSNFIINKLKTNALCVPYF